MAKSDKSKTFNQLESERTRTVKRLDGSTVQVRKASVSGEAIKALGQYRHKREIIGFIAINPPDIERSIARYKAEIMRSMAMMSPGERADFMAKGPIDFVKDKGNRNKYFITCVRCGEKIAYVWAKNDKLQDWCDLHYLSWHDKSSWYGCFEVSISKVDGHIGFECACGEDTREFRTNNSMPPIQKQLMVEYSLEHREFGTKKSAFVAVKG